MVPLGEATSSSTQFTLLFCAQVTSEALGEVLVVDKPAALPEGFFITLIYFPTFGISRRTEFFSATKMERISNRQERRVLTGSGRGERALPVSIPDSSEDLFFTNRVI